MEKLIELLQQQIASQERRHEEQERRHEEQERRHEEQMIELQRRHEDQTKLLQEVMAARPRNPEVPTAATTQVAATPNFTAFDSSSELWKDYWSRFCTFTNAHSVPIAKMPKVFLTNQTSSVYKMLSNLAAQETPPRDINDLTMDQISTYMKAQFDPKRFVVRERFRFWSEMKRKPGESIQELASRIRQAAATCDFASIEDPLNEALRTRFMCSVNNEAVLKALFKINADELTFTKAIEVAIETEDAAKVAKETVYGSITTPVHKIKSLKQASKKTSHSSDDKSQRKCYRCGKASHLAPDCRFKTATCNYCKIQGHLETVCRKKILSQKPGTSKGTGKVQSIETCVLSDTSHDFCRVPSLRVPVYILSTWVRMELDTATGGNFISEEIWKEMGEPELQPTTLQYQSASKHPLPILGTLVAQSKLEPHSGESISLSFQVTKISNLNLLGRDAIVSLGISLDNILFSRSSQNSEVQALALFPSEADHSLQQACSKLCDEYSEIFKPELGCLKDFELEIQFKSDTKPIFCKPRSVPFAIQAELAQAYDAGIEKDIWTPVQFNDWGTPVVPIRKKAMPNASKAYLRVCGDYSTSVNPQLEIHRHPLPLPEDLMRKLGGGHGFTKIDLADAYNQIKLGPASRKRLAISTHRGVLLQNRLPFGISSAPGYFQKIIDDLTSDLPGVAVYLDDILVSGIDADNHLQNLKRLLQRLHEKGIRCRREKCLFAQPRVEYLGHIISKTGISKGPKVDYVITMPAPKNVPGLRSFLGSVQFYGKFLPPEFSTVAAPLYLLLRNGVEWKWGHEQQSAFDKLKHFLSSDAVLVHFDPALLLGIACDASNIGIGATLFHRYPNGDEKPIANVSKLLSPTQRKYSQIQKEALAIIFALKKFYQYLFGRSFILVTDHKPLLALLHPSKPTPALAANRLARWALFLGQFQYTIEYRRTKDHQNADALSRLPSGEDPIFDEEEGTEDNDIVCAIETLSLQINTTDPAIVRKETSKDPVFARVMRFTSEGWPLKLDPDDPAQQFRKVSESLSTYYGCLLYGTRLVIPTSLQKQVLQVLHTSHSGMERMKQLARTAVYWPKIDSQIMDLCRGCSSCCEHRNALPKSIVHPWMMPEKPWSRLHVDHAINFLGLNWLVITDAYTKYPCIHPTASISTKATILQLEEDFSHFGYPHSIVSDNATCFTSDEFQVYCKERGIVHLTGAPYHPATNGAAERLIQSFKQALRKSSKPPREAVLEFLMFYRRTPTTSVYSPSELLNNRQLRTKLDVLLPSPVHITQSKLKNSTDTGRRATRHSYKVGDSCYAMYFGPRRNKDARWVPAVVTKRLGTRMFNVRVVPNGPVWRRHLDQLQPRYASDDDEDPGDVPSSQEHSDHSSENEQISPQPEAVPSPQRPAPEEYTRQNPRRSTRRRKPPDYYVSQP